MNPICTLITFSVLATCLTFAEAAEVNPTNAVNDGSGPLLDVDAKNIYTADPIFTFGGFGSLGVSHSSQGLGDYVVESTMPKGAGRSSNWSASNNSRLAAHMDAKFTPEVSAIFQVVSEYHSDGTFTPEIEWANIKYAFNPDAYIRLGRISLPTFLDSENWDVGYTYPWIHPPVDLYHQLIIPSSDGMDGMYRFEIGEAENSIKAIFGTNTVDRPTSLSTSRDMWGIFDTLEYDSTTFRVGYQERESSNHNLITGVTGPWIKNSDLTAGAIYDPGDWFAMSEWIQRKSTTKIGAMYISAGYRINKFTPYATYSQNNRGSFLSDVPPPSATALQLADRSQSTVSLGMRWDFMKNTDFKLQYDQVKLSDNSNGYLINVPANVKLFGTTFHVISAVVDFVF